MNSSSSSHDDNDSTSSLYEYCEPTIFAMMLQSFLPFSRQVVLEEQHGIPVLPSPILAMERGESSPFESIPSSSESILSSSDSSTLDTTLATIETSPFSPRKQLGIQSKMIFIVKVLVIGFVLFIATAGVASLAVVFGDEAFGSTAPPSNLEFEVEPATIHKIAKAEQLWAEQQEEKKQQDYDCPHCDQDDDDDNYASTKDTAQRELFTKDNPLALLSNSMPRLSSWFRKDDTAASTLQPVVATQDERLPWVMDNEAAGNAQDDANGMAASLSSIMERFPFGKKWNLQRLERDEIFKHRDITDNRRLRQRRFLFGRFINSQHSKNTNSEQQQKQEQPKTAQPNMALRKGHRIREAVKDAAEMVRLFHEVFSPPNKENAADQRRAPRRQSNSLGLLNGGGLRALESIDTNSKDFDESGNETTIGVAFLVGNDRDEHGCIASAGYIWCQVLEACHRPWETACAASGVSETKLQFQLLGDDRDYHGCHASAGYSWCEATQSCI